MKPWVVFASELNRNRPEIWSGAVQFAPPSGEEMNPTDSWQLEGVQLEFG